MKKLETVLITLFLILFFSNAQKITQISSQMVVFWFEQLIPSLFLSIFFIQILTNTSFFTELSKPFRFLLPILNINQEGLGLVFSCLLIGAPSSTLLINQACKEHRITSQMAQRCLYTCSVPTISFMGITLGNMLNSQTYGFLLWLIQIFSSFLLLVCTRNTPLIMKQTPQIKKHSIKSALIQTGTVVFLIGGYLLIFQNLSILLFQWMPSSIKKFIQIISEFSYGCKIISETLKLNQSFIYISALCGFGGFCVQFQSLSISDLTIPVLKYMSFRLLQSLFSFLTALTIIQLLYG